jgi:integrase
MRTLAFVLVLTASVWGQSDRKPYAREAVEKSFRALVAATDRGILDVVHDGLVCFADSLPFDEQDRFSSLSFSLNPTLRRALRSAQRWKVIDRLPDIRLLAGERQREFGLSREQEDGYLAACPQPLRDSAMLMLDTGLRVGEALALEWRDLSISSGPGCVQVRDGKSRYGHRGVPLTSRSRRMLEARRKGQNPCTSSQKMQIDQCSIQALLTCTGRCAGCLACPLNLFYTR